MIIQDPATELVTGHVGIGNMLLKEMFSPIGAPKEDDNGIDWADDLKFYINNDNEVLSKVLFPAIRKHTRYIDHPKAFKLYVRPLETCAEMYSKKFQVENFHEKLTKESLLELAKQIAEEQNKIIARGDYEN